MDIETQFTRLKAELCRNKAKSAVLLVMCVVAAYFWLPLLGKWFGKESPDDTTEVSAVETVDPSADVGSDLPTATRSKAKPREWRTAIRRLKSEPLMRSLNTFSLTRNPFSDLSIPNVMKALENEEEEKVEEPEESLPAPKPLEFHELGLVLNSTMIGHRSRMANVGGVAYREGNAIPVAGAQFEDARNGTRPKETRVKIDSIYSDYIIVRYQDRLHKLWLKPLELSQRDGVVVTRPLLTRLEH